MGTLKSYTVGRNDGMLRSYMMPYNLPLTTHLLILCTSYYLRVIPNRGKVVFYS